MPVVGVKRRMSGLTVIPSAESGRFDRSAGILAARRGGGRV